MSVLYIAPDTCAQAARTLVRELELPIGIEKVPCARRIRRLTASTRWA